MANDFHMVSILHIKFNSLVFSEFEIYNPPVIPAEGEIVNFRWEDFLEDEEDIKILKEHNENSVFICNVLCRNYSKGRVETHIELYEEENYQFFQEVSNPENID